MLRLNHRKWPSFSRWPLAAQIISWWLVSVALLVPAYQLSYPVTFRMSGDDSLIWYGYIHNFYSTYQTERGLGRPTNGDGQVSLWALGQQAPFELGIRLNATRPYGGECATILLDGSDLRTVCNTDWKQYRLPITGTLSAPLDRQVVEVQSQTWVPNDYNAATNIHVPWGVFVDWITVKPLSSGAATLSDALARPAWSLVAYVALLASAAFVIARRMGTREWIASLLAPSIIVLFAVLVAFFRLSIQAYLIPVTVAVIALLLLAGMAAQRRGPNVYASSSQGTRGRNRLLSLLLVAAILSLTWFLRVNALAQLPEQLDEQIYVPVSADYANYIAQGQWDKLIQSTAVIEHPLFAKLSFAVSILAGHALGVQGMERVSARMVSVVASMLLVALMALLNPIAGAALAIHSIQIKYASEAYLEAVPALSAALCVVAFERARQRGSRWLVLSAVMLGLTAAGKYVYAVAGVAVLPFLIWRYRRSPAHILLYGFVSLAVFLIADPILWPDPIGRLQSSLLFSVDYTQNHVVLDAARPWWWELPYLARLASWDPGIPYISPDTFIFAAGFLGLVSLARRSRVYLSWFLTSLLFLLIWPTKWEQYTLTLITPLCLSAGAGLTDFAAWLNSRASRRNRSAGKSATETAQRQDMLLER